jgi:ketosteroid isomerase-like protein
MMERSTEVEQLVRSVSDAMLRGDPGPALASVSNQPGTTMIGSDPSEWWVGHDTIVNAMQADFEANAPGGGTREVEAYEEGSVAWATMRGDFVGPNQERVEFRQTIVLRREDGEWKAVQAHASIGVPNEEMTNPILRQSAASTAS